MTMKYACGMSNIIFIFRVPPLRLTPLHEKVMLELLLNGCSPSALVLRSPDVILALGVIVAEEVSESANNE